MSAFALAALFTFLSQATTPATASIEGSVVRAGSNEPIAQAQVNITRLMPPAPAQARGATPQPPPPAIPPVLTDSAGKFSIKNLAAGTYRLTAAQNGFAKQEYGQKTLSGAGMPVTLQSGQTLKDIGFKLTPAGTLTGIIKDAKGSPAVGITVSLLRPVYLSSGVKSFQPIATTRTNDLGEYRLYWMTPGKYALNATTSRGYLDSLIQNNPSSQSAVETAFGVNSNEVVPTGVAVTYYPKTSDSTKAELIDLKPGGTLKADISLIPQTGLTVKGRLIDSRSNRSPATANIQMLNLTDPAASQKADTFDPVNGFEFRDVPPGSYFLMVIVAPPGSVASSTLSALQPIEVKDSDIQDLSVTVKPGVKIQGHVGLEGNDRLSSLPGFDRMRVRLLNSTEGKGLPQLAAPSGILPFGDFSIDGVPAGEYRVALANAAGVYIKSAKYGQADVLGAPLVVSSGTAETLDIILSPAASINGTLVDQSTKPVALKNVFLIPDKQRDRLDLFQTTPTDASGHFAFTAVPPGDYRIYAWEDAETYAFANADFLKEYESLSTLIKVADKAKLTPQIKIIPAPPQ